MPRVLAAALWKRLAQGQIDPCYLFFGEETYLIQEYTTTLIAQYSRHSSTRFQLRCLQRGQ